ncbi:NTP transferase domain-containing protein [Kribbella sp. NPDC023855]|uniref:nucleotidyltransferase family protein n=1 Tax=Kribbella sp. NPDC023855 TaxID=3154698 RepID=UPI0033D046F2
MTQINAVLLAGGSGRRMHPLTAAVPKVLLPFGTKNFLDRVAGECIKAGATTVTVVHDGGRDGLAIAAHVTESLGAEPWTAGVALRLVPVDTSRTPEPADSLKSLDLPGDGDLLIAHCDEFVPAALSAKLVEFARATGAPVALLFDERAAAPRAVRVPAVREVPSVGDVTGSRRLVGRLALPQAMVGRIRELAPTATTLIQLVVELSGAESVVAIEFGGPYTDLGTLAQYEKYWRTDRAQLDDF